MVLGDLEGVGDRGDALPAEGRHDGHDEQHNQHFNQSEASMWSRFELWRRAVSVHKTPTTVVTLRMGCC